MKSSAPNTSATGPEDRSSSSRIASQYDSRKWRDDAAQREPLVVEKENGETLFAEPPKKSKRTYGKLELKPAGFEFLVFRWCPVPREAPFRVQT